MENTGQGMRNERTWGKKPGRAVRRQSSSDHQSKAGGWKEHACPDWRSRDTIKAAVLMKDKQVEKDPAGE